MTIYKHRVFKTNIKNGVVAVIPTLNKAFLFNDTKKIPESINSSIIPFEEKKVVSNTTLWLVLTNKCNLACKYCYEFTASHKQTTMPKNVIRASLKYIFEEAARRKSKMIKIMFFGGEPTLAWDN